MNWKLPLILSFALILCGPALFSSSQGKKSVERVQRIKVKAGQVFKISLDANPSTGYVWQVQNPINQSLLKIVNRTFTPNSKAPGSPGKEIWEFKGMKKGTVYVMLAYKRSWEKAVAKKTTYAVIIQ